MGIPMTKPEGAPAAKSPKKLLDAAAKTAAEPAPPAPPRETTAQAQARAAKCWDEVRVILARHSCHIEAAAELHTEAVGSDGAGMLTRAVAAWRLVAAPLA